MAATVLLSEAGPSFDGYFTRDINVFSCAEAGFMIRFVTQQTCRTSKVFTLITRMTNSRNASSAYALHASGEMQPIRGDVPQLQPGNEIHHRI